MIRRLEETLMTNTDIPWFTYKNKNVYDTFHYFKRNVERINNLTKEDWEQIFKNMIDEFYKQKKMYKDDELKYFIFSKSYNIGFIVQYERVLGLKGAHFILVTVFPKGAKTKNADEKMYIEVTYNDLKPIEQYKSDII